MKKALLIALLPLLVGCNDVRRMLGRNHHTTESPAAPPVASQYTNMLKIAQDESGTESIESISDVISIAMWSRAQLEKPIEERRALVGRVAPQHVGYYFESFLLSADTDVWPRIAWCQRTAYAFDETARAYGLETRTVGYIDQPTGIGLHQFSEYRLRGMTGVIDLYYCAVYLDGGRPVSFRELRAKRLAMNDTDYLNWLHSIIQYYRTAPEQSHDVAVDWVVGYFEGGF